MTPNRFTAGAELLAARSSWKDSTDHILVGDGHVPGHPVQSTGGPELPVLDNSGASDLHLRHPGPPRVESSVHCRFVQPSSGWPGGSRLTGKIADVSDRAIFMRCLCIRNHPHRFMCYSSFRFKFSGRMRVADSLRQKQVPDAMDAGLSSVPQDVNQAPPLRSDQVYMRVDMVVG